MGERGSDSIFPVDCFDVFLRASRICGMHIPSVGLHFTRDILLAFKTFHQTLDDSALINTCFFFFFFFRSNHIYAAVSVTS